MAIDLSKPADADIVRDFPALNRSDKTDLSTGARGIAEAATVQSTTSTSFVDMPGMSKTITTKGRPVLINVCCSFAPLATSERLEIQLLIDGVFAAAAASHSGGNLTANLSLVWLAIGLSAASHEFKIQWRSLGGVQIDTQFAHVLTVCEQNQETA